MSARAVSVTVLSGPDERGRSRFDAEWTGPFGERRAQAFHANLDTHVRRWRAAGRSVVIRDGALVAALDSFR